MLITLLFSLTLIICDGLLTFVPSVQIDAINTNTLLTTYTNILFDNLGLIDLLAPIALLKGVAIICLTMFLAKHTWSLIMFIVHKIPILNIR